MPTTEVLLYAEADGSCPLLNWMDKLPTAAKRKCIVRLERLAQLGHELRRPEADLLRDGIHELRATTAGVHYRILYFLYEQAAVVSHGLIKIKEVPAKDILQAITNRTNFIQDPDTHTHSE